METDKGAMVIELFADKAPLTVNNFVFLAREGYYDGVIFHRVIDNFMAQGGDPHVVDNPGDVLPSAEYSTVLRAESSGWVSSLNALEIGMAALALGAGRTKKGETIDPAVGIVLHHKTGAGFTKGDSLCTVHSSFAPDSERFREVQQKISQAYQLSPEPVSKPRLILKILST